MLIYGLVNGNFLLTQRQQKNHGAIGMEFKEVISKNNIFFLNMFIVIKNSKPYSKYLKYLFKMTTDTCAHFQQSLHRLITTV